MEPLRLENDLTTDDLPSLGGGESISPQPAQGQHSGDSIADAVPVVQALVDVWSAALLDVAPLMRLLGRYLEKYAFLRLRFTPRGIRVEGKHVTGDEVSRELATLLLEDEITELLLKDGVDQPEIETLLDVLRQGHSQVPVNFDSLATLLWEADLQRVVFQCADELPGNQAREIEAFDMDNTALPVPDQMIADPKDEVMVSAVTAMDKFPRLEVEKLSIPLKRALFLSPNDELAAGALAVTTSEESLQNLIHRLVDVYSSETDAALQEDARALLVRVVEAELREKRLVQVHELLLWLRSQVDDGATQWDALIQIVQSCICEPQTVLLLGNVLNDRNSSEDDVQAIRELLLTFDERTAEPLCTLLEKLESMESRKLVCQVLAVVAAEDPAALARRAEGQPWYVARNLAYVLGCIGGTKVLPHLQEWVVHRDERVRVEVARALGKVEGSESTTVLCALLNDEQYRVRQSAVWALSHRNDPSALESLRDMLFNDRGFRERPAEERDDYFRTYGRLVTDALFDELVGIVEQRQIIAHGWKAELRRGAMIALGETGRSAARGLLQKFSKTRNGRLREAARGALRDIRSHGKVQPGVQSAMQRVHAPKDSDVIAWEEVGE